MEQALMSSMDAIEIPDSNGNWFLRGYGGLIVHNESGGPLRSAQCRTRSGRFNSITALVVRQQSRPFLTSLGELRAVAVSLRRVFRVERPASGARGVALAARQLRPRSGPARRRRAPAGAALLGGGRPVPCWRPGRRSGCLTPTRERESCSHAGPAPEF